MKKGLLLAVMILMTIGLLAQEQKEVITGAGYADDVYYSLENGTVTTVARDNWDIGFITGVYSISILANNGSGVELYTYSKGDTADWATLDTTGMLWSPMYNSIESFDEGAFSAHQLGHPDYGWGIYSSAVITGDSLFVIKTIAGTYKKLSIIVKNAGINQWEFKYANLNGTDEQSETLEAGDYTDKSFIYFSIDRVEYLDREPATTEWDLLFTKYFDYNIPYSVTGILSNEAHIVAQEVRESGMDQSTHISYEESAFESNISIIGSDWKKFDMDAMAYVLTDTVVYYLKKYTETDSAYYKLYFTGFTGMSEGKYTFMQEKLIGVSTETPGIIQMLEVYPNPAADLLNVVFDRQGEIRVNIIDATGRSVHSTMYQSGGFSNLSLNIADLNTGLYFLRLEAEDETQVVRFIKE